ncbi:MAG: FecR domain-containing protein, partial [Bacteroidota bacterium]
PSTGAKFTVVTEDLAVEVLGTRFNVNTYLTETEVVLNEGKIQLYLYQQPDRVVAPLSPGELFRFNATSTQIERTTVDTLAYTGWKDGEYVFEDTPLGEIIDKLSAVYGVEFVLGSEALRDVKVSTTASAENLDEFLRVLSLLFTGDQISVERQGNQISIQKNEPPM